MSLCVVIPAAGEGQRLRPHTLARPKVMLEVAGKPIIGHILDRVSELNPDKVCVIIPPRDRTIKNYLTGNYPLPLEFVVQNEPKGLGHAVLCAQEAVADLPVLILLGDTIADCDLKQFLKNKSIIAVKEVSDPRRFGVVLLENGVIKRVIEKPKEPVSNLAIVGVYYFQESKVLYRALNRLVLENRIVNNEYQFTDALQILADGGIEIRTMAIDVWLDCGTPEAILETNRVLLRMTEDRGLNTGASVPSLQRSVLIPPVHIADDAVIERSVVGPFVSVSSGARIFESVIRDALIYQGAQIECSFLEHSIVGENAQVKGRAGQVNVGPGMKAHGD
ncbi:MAG: sugar phosphate nucleotidyltransferase [candidate division WOR-3 bacterium]